MEKKQSSIEWYENKLIQLDIDFGGHKNYWVERKKLRDQAKAIHKEEICDAYCKAGLEIAHNDSIKESGLAQLYFNETFGGNND